MWVDLALDGVWVTGVSRAYALGQDSVIKIHFPILFIQPSAIKFSCVGCVQKAAVFFCIILTLTCANHSLCQGLVLFIGNGEVMVQSPRVM